jgi:S-adenosyl-L-methionine hydrolase (adenosine-forming)
MSPIVTLTTDFGWQDSYVAQLKGVMLGLAPGLTIVDVSHAVEPGDVQGAGEILADLPDAFPAGSVHVAVVDPGVGSARPLVAFQSAGQMWVGPDNGLWGRVAERYPPTIVHRIENRSWWRERVSSTFHGRDILGPVAARLASGWPLNDVGPVSHDALQALPQRAARVGPRVASGVIVAIDRFGNGLTNLQVSELVAAWGNDRSQWRITAGQYRIEGLSRCYADADVGEVLALESSQGRLEIAVRDGMAAAELGLVRGQVVTVERGAS